MEQRDDDGGHESRLSKNSRHLNRRNGYGVSGRHSTLEVSFLLDGDLEKSGTGGAGAFAGLTWGGNSPEPFASVDGKLFEYFDNADLPSGPVVVSVDFVWKQPFYLSMLLAAGVAHRQALFSALTTATPP